MLYIIRHLQIISFAKKNSPQSLRFTDCHFFTKKPRSLLSSVVHFTACQTFLRPSVKRIITAYIAEHEFFLLIYSYYLGIRHLSIYLTMDVVFINTTDVKSSTTDIACANAADKTKKPQLHHVAVLWPLSRFSPDREA